MSDPAPAPAPTSGVGASPAPRGLRILPVAGLGEFRPGDDLAGAIATAAPWITDDDVLVVTSKVVSKVEGRLVPAPTDPDQRDALRRELIDQQTVRLVAQVGRTRIVENHLGLIAAAAGIDASNVHADEIALLPVDPDASAAALVAAFAAHGVRVGVVITDTQGRAWRTGVTDVAIGAAGVTVLDDHRGGVDEHGNQLVVTQVAIGDELAAAADLVKGKLSGVPVAVVRGLRAGGTDGPSRLEPAIDQPGSTEPGGHHRPTGARALIRPFAEDLFRLGTDIALAEGRRDGAALAAAELPFAPDPVDPTEIEPLLDAARRLLPPGLGPVRLAGTGRDGTLVVTAIADDTTAAEVGNADDPAATTPPAGVRAGAAMQTVRAVLAAAGYTSRWRTATPETRTTRPAGPPQSPTTPAVAAIAVGRRRTEDEPTNRLAGPGPQLPDPRPGTRPPAGTQR